MHIFCRNIWSEFTLNISPAISAPPQATFGQGTGLILLDNLVCDGTESSLFNCSHNGVGLHNCDHSEDAGAVCPRGTNMDSTLYNFTI